MYKPDILRKTKGNRAERRLSVPDSARASLLWVISMQALVLRRNMLPIRTHQFQLRQSNEAHNATTRSCEEVLRG